jgi:hypothetical protein
MHKFSAKADWAKALCPTCGEYGTTNLSPEEQQEKAWECADCANKRLNELENKEEVEEVSPPIVQPTVPVEQIQPKDPGSEEITKYHPSYEFLVRLVKLVTKEGVPAQEIKALAEAYPFKTVNDIGDLTAKILTLSTTKYNIPREWLISKLPEKKVKGNLDKKALDQINFDNYMCKIKNLDR